MKKVLFLLMVLTLSVYGGDADNWPAWRGSTFNGVSTGTGFPTKWSQTENVAWKVSLPQGSGSTPIVWGSNIFITSVKEGKNLLICFDRRGNILWEKTVGQARKGKHRQKGGGAHPSPTVDGKRVYVYYRSGDLACLDFTGKFLWQENLQKKYGKDSLWWDLATSPVLTKNLLVVACLQDKPSYLVGLDKLTGKEVWKQDRNMHAPEESNHSYTTPVVLTEKGTEKIYVLGADYVTAHEAGSGKELWRVGGLNPKGRNRFRSIASPVVSDGILVAPYSRGATLTGIRLGGSGDVTDTHVAWLNKGLSSDVPTPAAVNGKVYLCTDKGTMACLDIKTGKEIWSGKLAARNVRVSSSPVVVDGKIYVVSEAGTTYVLEQGDKLKVLAANQLGEFTLATPVFTRNHILIRTYKHLYCIGK